MNRPLRRLVIIVRADPVICGHSGEARNLAEVALKRGFDDVRLLTWPIPVLEGAGLPLKPLDRLQEYSPGITVERPEPVGDYRVPDGRYMAGLTGRLVELLTDGVPTICLSMYLMPHTMVVGDAVTAAAAAGLDTDVTTIAKAVGSDVTNVIRNCLLDGGVGAAIALMARYFGSDRVVAVSEYTKDEIVAAATELDERAGTRFAQECRDRIEISYPAINTGAFLDLDEDAVEAALASRGLERNGYVLFLSRVARAKGVDDLIHAYRDSAAAEKVKLVVAGTGPQLQEYKDLAAGDDRIVFLSDVDDDEKPLLMRGCAAYALPTRPEPEFVETFGIALTEKMLAGGGPVITCLTGGTGEAVGDTAFIVPHSDRAALAETIDRAISLPESERHAMEMRARQHALTFDRFRVFDDMFGTSESRGYIGPAELAATGT